MNRRTLFFADCFHNFQRTIRKRHHARSVSDRRHHSKNHSETMEERHANTQFIVFGKAHTVAYTFSVVDYVKMRKHNAFRETRRSGSVLNIYNVLRIKRCYPCLILLVGNLRSVFFNVCKRHKAFRRFIFIGINNTLDKRHSFGTDDSVFTARKFREKLLNDFNVIDVFCSVHHNQKF